MYNIDDIIEDIPYEDVEEETDHHPEDWIELTGIYGIHTGKELDDLGDQFKFSFHYNRHYQVMVKVSTDKIQYLTIIKRSDDELYIDLFRMFNNQKGAHLGYKRLGNQIFVARKWQFKKLTLLAYGRYRQIAYWDGYIVWGKYGFKMYRLNDTTKFLSKMSEQRIRKISNVNDLVYSEEGTALWKYIGFSWKGVFELHEDAESNQIFNQFGKDRKIIT